MLTSCDLPHLRYSIPRYRLIVQRIKEDVQAPFRIVYDPFQVSLGYQPCSHNVQSPNKLKTRHRSKIEKCEV